MDWFLYDRDLRHERVNLFLKTLSTSENQNVFRGDQKEISERIGSMIANSSDSVTI